MLKLAETALPEGIRRRLVGITLALGGLTLLHDIDHVRQGRALPVHLYAVGVVAVVTIGFTLAVLLRRHPLAGPVAFVQGIVTVVGVGVVHAAPEWSTLADSYGAAHVDAFSWAIILGMMAAGALLAAIAGLHLRLLRR